MKVNLDDVMRAGCTNHGEDHPLNCKNYSPMLVVEPDCPLNPSRSLQGLSATWINCATCARSHRR